MKFFDFGEIQKSEETIYRTWTELRYSLKNKDFGYKDIDEAKKITFYWCLTVCLISTTGLALLQNK